MDKKEKVGILLLAHLFGKISREMDVPSPAFVQACAVAGKMMQNIIDGRPRMEGLPDWVRDLGADLEDDPGEPDRSGEPTPVPRAPRHFKI